jgi:hypothetical protein
MNTNQNAHDFWTRMVSVLERTPLEIQTVRLNGTDGLWFLASVRNNSIKINRAVNHQPSVDITAEWSLSEAEFIEIFPYYDGWKKGEIPRNEIRDLSNKTSYIFALIEYFTEYFK